MGDFRLSLVVTLCCVALAAWWGSVSGLGWASAVALVAVLGIMEVSLSFDNAVVNASVLKNMDARWRAIFLTVGMLVAVFGMRFMFPILIVSVANGQDIIDIARMAFEEPAAYANNLQASHVLISSFGGMFLLLVFLGFLFDDDKKVHWLGPLERRLSRLGRIKSIELMLALLVLFLSQIWMPLDVVSRLQMLGAGICGIILFVVVTSIDGLFGQEGGESDGRNIGVATRAGLSTFIYLEVLDASFSFDGVIGAFAITRDIVVIMLGLAIGAMFVRSLTVSLIKRGTLEEYVFLEHGAHYGIGALALIMLASVVVHVSEVLTGLAGIAFIALSLISSVRHRTKSGEVALADR